MNAPASSKISTPLVLVLCSTMISIGVAAALSMNRDAPSTTARPLAEVRVDTSSPERVAEAFLDAWRKRRFDAARAMSRGHARAQVEHRAEAGAHLSTEERQIEGMWDKLASARLDVRISESEIDGERRTLRGTAEGTFLDRPYRRRVEFVVVHAHDAWLVERMTLGEILEGGLLDGPESRAEKQRDSR